MKTNANRLLRNACLIACGSLMIGAAARAQNAPDPAEPAHADKRGVELALVKAQAATDAADAALQRVTVWGNRKGTKEKAAYLGVGATAADAAMRDQLKLPRGIGLVVNTVEEGSPAGEAGLQPHDIITKLDDQWLVNAPQLGVLIRMHKVGEDVSMTVVRQGQPQTIKAKLAEKEVFISEDDGSVLQGIGNGGFNGVWAPGAAVAGTGPGNFVFDGKQFMTEDDADVIIKENDRTLKIRMQNGERHLAVTDADDKPLFDGPIETEEQRKAVPADIGGLLEKYKEQIDSVKGNAPGNQRRVRIITNGK